MKPFLIHSLFPIPDLLATMVDHISHQISEILPQKGSVLVTGGGALNTFLIESIRAKTEAKIVLPQLELIQFKEALVFAFLGYLRLQNECNVWSDVTGASRNSCSGAVYLGS
jgi:anhydro-N-acetylmuramic acid kinase